MTSMSLIKVYDDISSKLSKPFFITDARLEARRLICHVKKYSLEQFFSSFNQCVFSAAELKDLNKIVKQRTLGMPIAYLVGQQEFFSRSFYVNSNVLIPRADTETLIRAVIEDYDKDQEIDILDLGVGSGCIIISLLCEFVHAKGVAVDVSQKALDVCKLNAQRHIVENRLTMCKSNWLFGVQAKKFDVVVANPPYIDHDEKSHMSYETKFEPDIALYADHNGLLAYKMLASNIGDFVKKGGVGYFEVSSFNVDNIVEIFTKVATYCRAYKDYAGKTRCVKFQFD